MGLCALAVLALAGCKKDEQTTSTIKATLTQPTGNAKTHIGNALYLVWDADDDIIVYTKDKTESATFSLTAGAETPNATFSGSIAESDSITAFYPKEGVDVTGEGKFVLPMSGSQTYKTNSFDTKTYPMCATAKVGDDLEFHSPYGLLGLQLKGSATVGSIELTGNNTEDLVGYYEIGSDTVFVANGEKTITLTFGTGGLVLDENTIDTVYFVLPAGVFAGGFTAVVKNTTNDVIDNLTTTNNNTIRRERIRMMSIKTLAEVQTEDPSAITSNSVTLHGSVVYEGPVGDIQAHGFSYSTTPDFEGPTGTVVPVTDWDNAKGIYTFHAEVEGLDANTTYYYRAFFNLTADPASAEYGGIKDFSTPTGLPVGAIGFPFSVSETQKVYFSKGNLQYIGSAGNGDANNTGAYWKFADHQWDRLGNNGQAGGTKQLDRDLFGWGVSGYNHGASAYQPWSTSTNNAHYYVYGNSNYHLYSQTGMADWGYNAIINGGNQENSGWRTLTDAEFNYVFYQRPAGLRNIGKVNNVNGLILLPDNWTLPEGVSFNSNWNNSFTNNVYDVEQWAKMEENGAVFLPCNGYRKNVGVVDVETRANYWTSYNPQSPTRRYCMCFVFYSTSAGATTCDRYYGLSVRLVRNVE